MAVDIDLIFQSGRDGENPHTFFLFIYFRGVCNMADLREEGRRRWLLIVQPPRHRHIGKLYFLPPPLLPSLTLTENEVTDVCGGGGEGGKRNSDGKRLHHHDKGVTVETATSLLSTMYTHTQKAKNISGGKESIFFFLPPLPPHVS